jgi:hypothetical protein
MGDYGIKLPTRIHFDLIVFKEGKMYLIPSEAHFDGIENPEPSFDENKGNHQRDHKQAQVGKNVLYSSQGFSFPPLQSWKQKLEKATCSATRTAI